jgi:hypothetical protein
VIAERRDDVAAALSVAFSTLGDARRAAASNEHPLKWLRTALDFQSGAAALQASQRAAEQSGGLGAQKRHRAEVNYDHAVTGIHRGGNRPVKGDHHPGVNGARHGDDVAVCGFNDSGAHAPARTAVSAGQDSRRSIIDQIGSRCAGDMCTHNVRAVNGRH